MNKKNSWDDAIGKTIKLFKSYSISDVATSLFISSLWLPNVGSNVKHQLHVAIFSSIKQKDFCSTDKITNYSKFSDFTNNLYKLTPDFPTLEDYIPNFDWGSIKFSLGKINYKIFYETGIDNIYDFLAAFQLLYIPFEQEYQKLSGRSPKMELKQCLNIQNEIINKIDTQPSEDKLSKIPIGYIEIPSEKFWLQVQKFYRVYCTLDLSAFSGLDDYCTELGSFKEAIVSESDFYNKINEECFPSAYFIRNEDKHYPILARRFSVVLIDKWSKIFTRYNASINVDNFSYQRKLSIQVAKFLQERFERQVFYPIVSAVYDDNKPHELIFSGFLISKEKLVLFYITKPFSKKEEIEKELTEIESKLKEAISLIEKEPVTLALHLERKNIVYKSKTKNSKLKPQIFVVLSQATMEGFPIVVPEDFPARITFLDQFLGVMDEINKPEELSEFIDYLDTIEDRINFPITTLLDKYGSFKDSYGVLIRGANEPDIIMVDTHWGGNYRYESLRSFWKIYPEINFMGHPRSWKVEKETPNRVRLSARSYFGCAIFFKIKDTNIFLTSPFEDQNYEQGMISNLIMECIEDYMTKMVDIISNLCFFNYYNELIIIVFPDELILKKKFKHIKHLNPSDKYWESDIGYPEPSCPGIRLVFNKEKLLEVFKESISNDIEVDLLIEIFIKLDNFCPDSNLKAYIANIQKQKGKKPRFKIIYQIKKIAFPQFISVEKPTIHDHKMSRRIEAQIANSIGIQPGKYKLNEAKKIMNSLRKEIVKALDKEISEYAYEENIKYLITRIDALANDFYEKKIILEESLKHEVDFIREEHYSEAEKEFIGEHKNYRYLIEKFVQIQPIGERLLDNKSFRYFIALVDKISEIYNASDSLNYEIYPVGLTIDRDFVIQVEYKDDLEKMQREYAEEQAKIDLGIAGNETDRAGSSIPAKEFLNSLDSAFKKDFGFGIKNMVNLLQVMSSWPKYNNGMNEAPYYSATVEEISAIATKAITGYETTETEKILDFLTLKSKYILKIISYPKPAEDLPVWEHKKRLYRYMIRPLIFINGKYYWGPHSVDRSGRVWMDFSNRGTLPVDLIAPSVGSVLKANQTSIEKNLENKALEITKRHTKWADKVSHKRETHPQRLGDYDVLAYIPEIKILLNIECKNIFGAYCLKDAKRIRDRIFRLEYEKERKVKNPGNLLKVENREEYLKDNIKIFKEKLGWPIEDNTRIISVYITRMNYWWTKFPPRKTTVRFMRIDFLDNYICELKEKYEDEVL